MVNLPRKIIQALLCWRIKKKPMKSVSDFASLQKAIEDLGKKQDRQYQELRAIAQFLMLKEVNPELIRIIAKLPKLSPMALDDFYNRFSLNVKSTEIIRQWASEMMIQFIYQNNILSTGEARSIARNNLLDCAEKTTQYPAALNLYTNFLADGIMDRLPAAVILPEFRNFLREKDFFRKEYRKSWFLHFALLLEAGEKKECERLVRKWDSQFGSAQFHFVLPLAHFVRELGFKNTLLEKAADIWEAYLHRLKNGPTLATLLHGRSIAVVGNGPQEIGLELGEEIDAHDVVIRFNDYQIKEENSVRDYGRRVTIGCMHIRDFVPLDTIPDLEALLCISNLSRTCFDYEPFLDRMSNYLKSGKFYFQYDDVADVVAPLHKQMTEKTGISISIPSSGYRVAVALKALRPDLGLKNFYGFSCKAAQSFNQKEAYHYNPDNPILNRNYRLSIHDFELERQALRWLLSE